MDKSVDTRFYIRQSHIFFDTKKFDKAIIIDKRLITMDPKYEDHHYRWALIRCDQEEYSLSELKLREVLILNPQNAFAFNTMGNVLSRQGKSEQAISSYKNGLKLSRNNLDITHNIAIEYTLKGDYEEAVEWYEKALELSPHDASTHNCIGYLYFLRGKLQEAVSKFNDAIQSDPYYEMPYFNKAMALFCWHGMEKEAQNAFELGIKALAGGNAPKLHKLKVSVNVYNREMDRVGKELECGDLEHKGEANFGSIQAGLGYILDLLGIEIEKLENL